MVKKRVELYKKIKLMESTELYDNFKYKLVETPKTIKLIEIFIGNEAIIGQVRSWKTEVLKNISKTFDEKDERERGYRLFLTVKVLNRLRNGSKIPIFLKVMRELTLEETIFWVWQYHSHGRKAINAFNCIHLRKRQKRDN